MNRIDYILSCANLPFDLGSLDPEAGVYAPRAVVYGPKHAHEGGGGLVISQVEAVALGAINLRWAKDGQSLVADWPQHYWPPQGPSCPCGACSAHALETEV